MILKVLQLNAWEGAFTDKICEYILKEDFDVVNMQEVTGGGLSIGGKYNDHPPQSPQNIGIDLFKIVQEKTGMKGFMGKILQAKNDLNTYEGNATFIKKHFEVVNTKIVWLNALREYENVLDVDPKESPRCAIATVIGHHNIQITIVNTHLAWGPKPTDEIYKIHQANILKNYLETIQNPYILSGDFNMTPETQVVKMFSRIANDVGAIYDVKNTLNPRVHKAKNLFPPGLCVDYFFIHPLFHIKKFKVIEDIDLSDHLGLSVEVEI